MIKKSALKKEFELSSGLKLVPPLVEDSAAFFEDSLSSEDIFALKLVLTEVLNNGISHGNENDETLKVKGFIELDSAGGQLLITVTDEGKGFDWQVVLDDERLEPDDEQVMKEKGRGYLLIRVYGFEYKFNDKGNTVLLSKRVEPLT